jgi:ferrochelatase
VTEQHLQGWATKTADHPMELQASRERALAIGAKD